jgi:DNA-directed RNA polymerase subunit beta
MSWEGYNFEDAKIVNEHLIYENIYTFIHTKKYEIETHTT